MKITKVNNQKIAVEGKQEKNEFGYLYQNKNRGSYCKDTNKIKDYVSKRVNESQKLYSPFVPKKINNKKREETKKLQHDFLEKVFKNILLKKNSEMNENEKIKALYDLTPIPVTLNAEETEKIMRESLRKSLKRKDSYQTLVDIAYAMCDKKNYSERLRNIGNERLKKLIDIVNEDRYKWKETENIVKSIEQQNVKVQVVSEGEKVHLEISNSNGKNKLLFEELKRYAEGEESQKTVLNHMNQALILFYPECESVLGEGYRFDIANVLRSQIGPEMKFSKEVNDIFATNSNSKNATVELRTAFLDEVFSRKRRAIDNCKVQEIEFWVNHITLKLQNKFKKNRALVPSNNELAYMIEMSWKDILEYLGKKYIDMGKAVYHFAMPVEYEITNGAVFGEVKEAYREGISSFDYEEIKANETIDRKLSTSIHFACNQFQGAVGKGNKEILSEKLTELLVRKDAIKSFLRYFGGESYWKSNKTIISADPIEFVGEIKTNFYYLRNRYYHYISKKYVDIKKENGFVQAIFEQEQQLVASQIRKKYYSNNIPMFFSENNIKPVMDYLYQSYKEREAQIPAFNKIIKRKDLRQFYKKWTKCELDNMVLPKNIRQYEGTIYFLLKEIYYYGFLTDSSAKEYFNTVVKRHKKNSSGANKNAERNIIEAINEMGEEVTLANVCQSIMTQYAMENNRNNLLAERKMGTKKKFDHFPLLLYQFLQEAFMDYLNQNDTLYAFMKKKPMEKDNIPSEEEFLSEWNTTMYQKMFEHISDNQMAWYLAAHFMPQREVNQLIGSIKSYIQFIDDIKKRAQYARDDRYHSQSDKKVNELKRVLEILDFTLKVCLGRFSKEFEDYYWGREGQDAKDAYAEEMVKYVKYYGKNEARDYLTLSEFCKNISDDETKSIYVDGNNPILLRNVELARLFGASKILACEGNSVVNPITKDELQRYVTLKGSLEKKAFNNPEQTKTEEIQEKICRFQQLKNRVELHDVLTLAEIVNDLHSYLVSLAYIRERDLLYYQLGYYYMKLQFAKEYKKELNCLEGPDCSIKKGAVLYQVQAMYTYGMQMFDKNGCFIKKSSDVQIGKKVRFFHDEYSDYEEGMQLFGQGERMKKAIDYRNCIDHASYYNGDYKKMTPKSILELYSGIYDYFFTYDKKLKKSVPIVFENILLKYNIEVILEFGSCSTTEGKKETDFKIKTVYDYKEDREYTLKSLKYTYYVKPERERKKQDKTPKMLEVHSMDFLKQVEKLLNFVQK